MLVAGVLPHNDLPLPYWAPCHGHAMHIALMSNLWSTIALVCLNGGCASRKVAYFLINTFRIAWQNLCGLGQSQVKGPLGLDL